MKEYRSSVERHNAPYRGISSREDAVNFDLAVIHDLFHLEKVSGGNKKVDGHKQFTQKNLSGLYLGETDVQTSIPTAGRFVSSIGEIPDTKDLTKWSKKNDAAAVKEGDGFRLTATGKLPAASLSTIITVNPGDIILLRLHIDKVIGQETKIAIGALNFNNDGDELDIYPLNDFQSGHYIEKRLYCTSRQDIRLALYVAYETKQGVPVEWLVKDFSVEKLNESLVGINGLEHTVKPALEVVRQSLSFVEEQIEKGSGQ